MKEDVFPKSNLNPVRIDSLLSAFWITVPRSLWMSLSARILAMVGNSKVWLVIGHTLIYTQPERCPTPHLKNTSVPLAGGFSCVCILLSGHFPQQVPIFRG